MERRDECARNSRIVVARPLRIEAGMRDVAASAAGNSDFGEKFGAAFEDGNLIFRIRLCAGNRGEESRRASADDCDLHRATVMQAREVAMRLSRRFMIGGAAFTRAAVSRPPFLRGRV